MLWEFDNPQTNLRARRRVLGEYYFSIMRRLYENTQHFYHLQRVQPLCIDESPTRCIRTWYLQQRVAQPDFPSCILSSDESCFIQVGVMSLHNMHIGAHENPKCTRAHAHQQRFVINIWAVVIGDMLIDPYLLPQRLDGNTYGIFLERVAGSDGDAPAARRRNIWFQHDEASAHFSYSVREYLDSRYPNRWIGRNLPVAWPPRSPGLHFYL